MEKRKIYIGTSGWVYDDWWERFYPINITQEERLEYFSKYFATVEINTTFYHLPRQNTFETWYKKTPENFAFSAKMSKYITQNLKLKSAEEPLANFLQKAKSLGNKLSVILVQLPPNFRKDLERLENFLKLTGTGPVKSRWAVEFRHESWLTGETDDLLKKYQAGLVVADSAGKWPSKVAVTSDFVYLRFHGPSLLYSSSYSDAQLKRWAGKVNKWLEEGLDVYAYFNNDVNAYAVRNALKLKELINL